MKLLGLLLLLFSIQTFAKTKCIAHRGNNVDHFENSMAALISAVEVGSDGVEFDIHHTYDGIAILSHDKTLLRLAKSKTDKKCPVKKKISKLTYLQIKESCLLRNGEEIPTLQEALDYLLQKDIDIVVEFKDVPNLKTLRLMENTLYADQARLKIISFKKKALEFIRYFSDVMPYYQNVELLRLEILFRKAKKYYDPNILYTKKHLKRLKKYVGKRKTGVWTVDNKDKMKKVFDAKIDYLTTNNPKLCLEIRDQRHP